MSGNDEKLKNESVKGYRKRGKNGGKRPGAGRKKGGENAETKFRREALRQFKMRVAKNTQRLMDAQMTLAFGTNYLFEIHYEGKGKSRKKIVERVTDIGIIEDYLNGNLQVSESSEEGYFFVTTQDPDPRSIDSLLDRTFGKATTPLALDEDSDPLTEVIVKIVDSNETGNASNKRISKNNRSGKEI